MRNLNGALAIFVKTPEFSPVKTRLAASIGVQNATHFYELSLKATTAMAKALQASLPQLQIYWAVAETEALDSKRWSSFPTISQGTGGLGARLSLVYSEFLKSHPFACFIGADSPHLSVENLKTGIVQTEQNLKNRFVIGKTFDGGFYFFGGGIKVSPNTWRDVEYSTEQTAEQLMANLSAYGQVEILEKTFDVDTIDDLRRYTHAAHQSGDLLTEQRELVEWVAQLLNSPDH